LLDPENPALLVARESRRVEYDGIERAPLFRKAAQPVEGVALAEVVRGGIERVMA
jgi:hypothetical protein